MKNWIGLSLLTCVLAWGAFTSTEAFAQRPGGGRFGGMMGRMSLVVLAGQESVQAELKLTDAQKKQLADLQDEAERTRPEFPQGGPPSEEFFETMRKRNAEMDEKVGKAIDEPQLKRLKEIRLQNAGAAGLLDEEVAKTLNITDEQKSKVQEIQQSSFEAMRQAREQNQGAPEAMIEQMTKLRKEIREKALALLTAEQRKKYDELAGAPFTGQIRFGFGGRGRG